MKLKKILAAAAACAVLFLTAACSAGTDAGVLFREAKMGAEQMKSCSASMKSTLVFTANGTRHEFLSSSAMTYTADPFALKAVQSSQNDGQKSSSETYTVTENGGLWFYGKNAGGWQKTSAAGLDTSPLQQIDVLTLLQYVKDEKYVRETTLNSRKVHKIELKMDSGALRSTIENIVTASGMAGDSKTIVQTLLNSAPPVYGYGYIDTDSDRLVRIELDTSQILDQVFQNIDGSSVTIHVTKSIISGDISNIGRAPAVALPEDAKAASSVQACG
ncbi:MAG: hypothetical protein LKJ45_04745 [Oscillospiraceae bacterium]|jgi:hypothetical protein|nr:hypothetical protein [Oscillospiraceae bacterium]